MSNQQYQTIGSDNNKRRAASKNRASSVRRKIGRRRKRRSRRNTRPVRNNSRNSNNNNSNSQSSNSGISRRNRRRYRRDNMSGGVVVAADGGVGGGASSNNSSNTSSTNNNNNNNSNINISGNNNDNNDTLHNANTNNNNNNNNQIMGGFAAGSSRKDDPVFNVKFVQLVERHACLWNSSMQDYSKKEKIQEAWQAVATDTKDTVRNCRERWRTIRSSFLRSLKLARTSTGRGKRKYYLSKYLQFLIPYTKTRLKNGAIIPTNAAHAHAHAHAHGHTLAASGSSGTSSMATRRSASLAAAEAEAAAVAASTTPSAAAASAMHMRALPMTRINHMAMPLQPPLPAGACSSPVVAMQLSYPLRMPLPLGSGGGGGGGAGSATAGASAEDTKDSAASDMAAVAIAEEDVLVSLHEGAAAGAADNRSPTQMQAMAQQQRTSSSPPYQLQPRLLTIKMEHDAAPPHNMGVREPDSERQLAAMVGIGAGAGAAGAATAGGSGTLMRSSGNGRGSSVDLTEFAEWIKSKTEQQRHHYTNPQQADADESFLFSLHPFLKEMTGKQNRRFRQKVVALIDAVLDNAD